ncbi:hypothetical protein [Bacillus sp. FJAT-47783]|uniref:hypothetical protein n=1 Tax=Bacillus sp. FJAT-47783 TaxID=2922712 RepID=UPI001FAE4A55|nr:hypothetical protein [Bacillus sp. FJAT-47783]
MMILPFIVYFPQDKSEYFGAFLQMIPFIVLAFVAVWFFKRVSKREQQEADELMKKIKERKEKD